MFYRDSNSSLYIALSLTHWHSSFSYNVLCLSEVLIHNKLIDVNLQTRIAIYYLISRCYDKKRHILLLWYFSVNTRAIHYKHYKLPDILWVCSTDRLHIISIDWKRIITRFLNYSLKILPTHKINSLIKECISER